MLFEARTDQDKQTKKKKRCFLCKIKSPPPTPQNIKL